MSNINNIKPISKGYQNVSVELIDYNKDIGRHVWNIYRMTWNNLHNVEYDVENKECRKAIENVILMRALPMPREQAIMTFRINNISRVCLAQITRQRKAAFNVESQMPRPINHNVIMPLNIAKDDELSKDAEQLIKMSQALYNKCIEKGIPPQDARYMTMHGQTCSLCYVVDINTFCSSFGFRCENNLSDEINLVYRLCKYAILQQIEKDYVNNEIDKLTYEVYKRIISQADCAGARQKVGTNYDEVFGNSFARYSDKDLEVAAITANCSYDYKKSAWYLELKKMRHERPELLFEDEAKMIDSWEEENE